MNKLSDLTVLPETVDRTVLRDLIGCNDRTLSNYRTAGLLVSAARDRYKLVESMRNVCHFMRNRKGTTIASADAKDRLAQAQAEKVEMEVALMKKELLKAEDFGRIQRLVVHNLVQWLAMLPDSLERRGLTTDTKALSEFVDGEREALLKTLMTDLADVDEEFNDE